MIENLFLLIIFIQFKNIITIHGKKNSPMMISNALQREMVKNLARLNYKFIILDLMKNHIFIIQ